MHIISRSPHKCTKHVKIMCGFLNNIVKNKKDTKFACSCALSCPSAIMAITLSNATTLIEQRGSLSFLGWLTRLI